MKYEALHYYSIRYKLETDGQMLVGLVAIKVSQINNPNANVYWGGSPTHWPRRLFAEFEIVKDHGLDSDWPDDFDVDIEHIKMFPPKPSLTVDALSEQGMLSPEGVYYDCEYGGHTELCHDLMIVLYGQHESNWKAEDEMRKRGWVSLRQLSSRFNHPLISSDVAPTDKQIAFLRSLSDSHPGLKDAIEECLSLFDRRFADK